MKKYRGEIGLVIVALIWGSGFVASDVAIRYFSPYKVIAIRFSIGAIFMILLFYKEIKNIQKSTLKHGIFLGIILYISFLLQTIGLTFTTPSKNAFLTSINVIIVPFIGLLIFKRKIEIYGIIGAFLSIVGIAIISFKIDLSINIGDILTILCAFGFAIHIFATGEFLKRKSNSIHLTIIQMIVVATIATIVTVLIGEKNNTGTFINFKEAIIASIYLGLFSTSIAFFLQTTSQKYITETKAAIIMSMESLFGALLSIIILKEHITLRIVIGATIIIFSIIISEIKPKKIK